MPRSRATARRFITAQKSREGARFDEALIKSLTGGDLITERFLHREFFTFKPTWKIWLATNHRPDIQGTDGAIWSRPRLIPFKVSFEGREDKGLKERLLMPASLSGVLRWAVEGCRAYLADGDLMCPAVVTEATAEYKTDSDAVQRFINEMCVIGDWVRAHARQLYIAYKQWAESTGEKVISNTAFGLRLKEKGYAKDRDDVGMVYLNIGLRVSGE